MRVVFFGTPDFAVPTLEKLLCEPDFEVVGVVSQPDTRRGRGNQVSPPPVKAAAIAKNPDLKIWQPDRLKKDKTVLAELKSLEADVFVVVAYGQILCQKILNMPNYGCINVHGSLLPKYRGAAPIQWAIANGESITGITTMQMDAGIDTGAMLLKAELEILPEENTDILSRKLANLGADLLVDTLRQLTTITPEPQDDALSCYSPMIGREDWELDWNQEAIAVHNRIRAFYPNCYTDFRGQRLKITQTEVLSEGISLDNVGKVTEIRKGKGFVVQTGKGLLLIKEVQPAGKKLQSGWDFVNGMRIVIGESLS
ncbi:MAG: methionyl-tRNA formyltransferase [Pseudanabaena sp.]|jgi:methionyl-tRNA formyltransferase|nr:methionyl-tRNA formyltransferase [Pseudanabaena sp. M090S1SP2A07QC]MCA6505074.1 methionyl-tRNA formyltransferase [Pseudanabaena sp. M172S2SP2A07QC]MCA6509488.1 methionyl-tRNA formyltransferase [Pseudanabaena sp. M109S1SP2A07QC]MCA6520236.1 methionyl-tRNA formyltransferase [Pseudanabaena sp. M110S1SP2A07QC]MCA6520578.1 methionyl-tRNA formyltransferase [Pseudanabaena sp. M051S1SP2A07QC]MCA6525198.1 methionyl-tRNA formyltransferase [Pseudanabaena sp. M179S2SP2A07QC]MCA6529398.1 methionyl-tRNA